MMILLALAGEGATPRSSRLSTEGRRGGAFPYDDISQVHDPRQAQQAGPGGALPSQASLTEGPQDGYADSQGDSHHEILLNQSVHEGMSREYQAGCYLPIGAEANSSKLLATATMQAWCFTSRTSKPAATTGAQALLVRTCLKHWSMHDAVWCLLPLLLHIHWFPCILAIQHSGCCQGPSKPRRVFVCLYLT